MIRTALRPLARILPARAKRETPDEAMAASHALISEHERKRADKRLALLACFFVLGFGTVGVQMGAMASGQQGKPQTHASSAQILSRRADITDRHGRVLATNLLTHSIYAHPRQMIDPARAAHELARIFPDLEEDKLRKSFDGTRSFVWIEKKISPEQMQAVHDIGEPGLLFGPREMRLYPNGHAAAHILGGVKFGREDVNGAEILGMAGVEKAFDNFLREPTEDGAPLALSIDLAAQSAMEEVLANGMKVMNAKGATAIFMEVKTGEVIAMASLPDFDPNDRPRPLLKGNASDSPLFNRAVQGQYELGSTFKIFPVAQAVDAGLINPRTLINTQSPIKIGKHLIHDFHRYGDTMSVSDIIAKSSNVGTVRVAQMLGVERQKAFLKKLGLFEATPIEMVEASTGRPLVPNSWPAITSATVAFGHGLAASPLHLATAYATIANDGKRVTPTLIHGRKRAEGEAVLSPAASHVAMQLLRGVVTNGSGRSVNIEGYEVAGKTGTADKPNGAGKYSTDKVVATFASAFPASDPQYVLVVTLDEAWVTIAGGTKARTAGHTAGPVAAELIRRLAPIVGLRPQGTTKLPTFPPRPEAEMQLVAN